MHQLSTLLCVLALHLVSIPGLAAQKGGGQPTPPPADASIAFRKDGRLCLARLDGSGQTVVGTRTVDGTIAWAAGGGPIFFQSPSPNGVHRIRSDGTGEALVVPMAQTWHTGVSVTRGLPCPDGAQRIFYTDGPNGIQDLWTARLDGSDRIRLSAGQVFTQPVVSPGGDKVVVVDNLEDLRVLTLGIVEGRLAVTASQSLVLANPGHPLGDHAFYEVWFEDPTAANPSGTQLLVSAEPGDFSQPVRIHRMDLTAPAFAAPVPLPAGRVSGPCTTFDGRFLFYVAMSTNNQGTIYRANVDGTGAVRWADPGRRGNHRSPCTKPQ